MKKNIILPRNRYEDECLEDYKVYLRELYFENQKPEPLTRYDFAETYGLQDVYDVMDGKNGEYTKYLEEYYQEYYKKLDRKVNKAVRKYGKTKDEINRFTNKFKLPKFDYQNSKIKSIIDKVKNFSVSEEVFRKAVNTIFCITLGITVLSFASFFLMKNAMGLIIGTIGILAAKTLAPERKTKEEQETKKTKKERNKTKISLKTIKNKLVNVFAKKKTTSDVEFVAEEDVQEKQEEFDGFDTTVEEQDEISFDTSYEEIEVVKDTEEIHVEPEIVFDTNTSEVETVVTPLEVTEIEFDTEVPEYTLNEGQPGKLEVTSLDIPKNNTKLSVYIPNFFKEKMAKLNSKQHVKVMKK